MTATKNFPSLTIGSRTATATVQSKLKPMKCSSKVARKKLLSDSGLSLSSLSIHRSPDEFLRRFSGDASIQSTGSRRRYLRRGSRAPTMFVLSKIDLESCLALVHDTEEDNVFDIDDNVTSDSVLDGSTAFYSTEGFDSIHSSHLSQRRDNFYNRSDENSSTSNYEYNVDHDHSAYLPEFSSAISPTRPIIITRRLSISAKILNQFEQLSIKKNHQRCGDNSVSTRNDRISNTTISMVKHDDME
jgi:hypothetical protein